MNSMTCARGGRGLALESLDLPLVGDFAGLLSLDLSSPVDIEIRLPTIPRGMSARAGVV